MLSPASFSLTLLLVTSSLHLLSLLSCHYSPSTSLLLLALITFCHLLSFSASTLSIPPPPVFLPHLLHLSVVSFSSSLSPPLQSNLHQSDSPLAVGPPSFPTAEPRPPDSKNYDGTCLHYLLSCAGALLSEVPNYLNAKLNLVPAL